jgi:hypothetical protein
MLSRWVSLLRSLLRSLWRHHEKIASWTFRFLALPGIAYLVYDRIFEADVTISSVASDPQYAFRYPFTITNNSRIFSIRDVRWSCQAIRLVTTLGARVADGQTINGTTSVIPEAQSLNIMCNLWGPGSSMAPYPRVPVIGGPMPVSFVDARIRIALEYKLDFFGLFSFSRKPSALFTWAADASNPQWVRGEFAR